MTGRVAVFWGLLGVAMAASAGTTSHYSLSFQNIHLAQGERVVGVDMQVTNAQVVQLTQVPAGWTLTTDNDPSGKTVIRGNALVGAAAMEASDLNRLVQIARQPGLDSVAPVVSGEIVVTTDFEHDRHITLDAKSVTVKPSK